MKQFVPNPSSLFAPYFGLPRLVRPARVVGGAWRLLLPVVLLLIVSELRAQTSPYTQITLGQNHTAALRADGTLWAWGYNGYSQLGNGNNTGRTLPAQVAAPVAALPGTRWSGVTSGSNHIMALRTDGTLWAWGYNGYNQLGDGTKTTRVSPVLVPVPAGAAAGTTWTQVSSREFHTLALRSDGTLWAWGYNVYGQLGDNTTTDRLSAVAVTTPAGAAAGTTWTQITTGRVHSLALRSDGTLWGWGYNAYGTVGDGSSTTRLVPTAVITPAGAAAGTRWTSISGGDNFSLALRSDGTLWAWGYNAYGQLGDASTTISRVPIAVITPGTVGAGTRWAQVTAGDDHTSALRSDGSLWAWGYNNYGQIGDNTKNNRSTPVRETSNSTWGQLTAGQNNTLAVQAGTGLIFGTGYNAFGQLGNGSTTNTLVFIASSAPVLATRAAATAPALAVYPNPAHARCQLPALPAGTRLRLIDGQGRVVRVQAAAPALSLEGLSAGLYLLTVQAPGLAPSSTRVVVE
ncbi:hypothetical protein GCM10022408_02630 [Hymenobacter fastidiosus]|uniref:RCC1-like domain-containing protein n=1 Tax=Hymenobacter fastidiosus TaxID=486264 RepID=A0ABP7RC70_9BACT